MKYFLIAYIFFCQGTFAQQQVQGVVLNGADSTKLIAASVFINNSTRGTITGEDGKFVITGIPETNFQLVVSYVGFIPVSVNINSQNINQFYTIKLFPRKRSLEEISIMPLEKNGWRKWGKLFTQLFIGTSGFAKDCKIENPLVIQFYQNKKTGVLHAYSIAGISIRNKALGYNINYLLQDFTYNPEAQSMHYIGYSSFEDLSGKNKNKLRRWIRNRHFVYVGSLLHFMRSLYRDNVIAQGFVVRDKIRIYAKDSVFNLIYRNGNMAQFVKIHDKVYSVSIGFADTSMTAVDYIDLLDTSEFSLKKVTTFDAAKKELTFHFENYLDVNYINPIYKSEITLVTDSPLIIEESGLYVNPTNLLTEGHWAGQRVAETLPFDYVDTK